MQRCSYWMLYKLTWMWLRALTQTHALYLLKTYVYVAMETRAAVDALVGALAYAVATVTVRTGAVAAVRAAADAAVSLLH